MNETFKIAFRGRSCVRSHRKPPQRRRPKSAGGTPWAAPTGERVNKIAADFNASQDDYTVVPTYKGNYTETMTAAVAAFRAGEQPHLVQVFEVGTATMMAAKGAIYPVEQMMADAGEPFDGSAYLPAVVSYYQTPEGELLSIAVQQFDPGTVVQCRRAGSGRRSRSGNLG